MQSAQNFLSPTLSAARAAGALLRSRMEGPQQVLSAHGKDIKLQADQDAEALIKRELLAAAPYPILAEESGLTAADGSPLPGTELPAGPVWIVDPLDGTFNYDRGLPLCCVSIALWETPEPALGKQAEPRIGVIYDFNRDELFAGVVGRGGQPGEAWLEHAGSRTPIRASQITDRSKAALATGFPVARDFGDESLKRFVSQIQQFKKQRLIGTAALAMAYTACGRVDAYFEEGGRLWDVAAGIALVQAAGGVTRWSAVGLRPWSYNVVAAGTRELLAGLS